MRRRSQASADFGRCTSRSPRPLPTPAWGRHLTGGPRRARPKAPVSVDARGQDFGFERRRTILETNGRRWHDDPDDYEHDNEKWSVPAPHGYRIVFATWAKVTKHPQTLLDELAAALAA